MHQSVRLKAAHGPSGGLSCWAYLWCDENIGPLWFMHLFVLFATLLTWTRCWDVNVQSIIVYGSGCSRCVLEDTEVRSHCRPVWTSKETGLKLKLQLKFITNYNSILYVTVCVQNDKVGSKQRWLSNWLKPYIHLLLCIPLEVVGDHILDND